MSNHKNVIDEAVSKLEEIVNDLEHELRKKVADLKVMKLMAAQCREEEE